MRRCARIALGSVVLATAAMAAESTKQADTTILDLDKGSFVAFAGWRTPVVLDKDGKAVPLPGPLRQGQNDESRKPRVAVAAEAPGKDWATLDFDDSRWIRVGGALFASDPERGHSLFYVPGAPVEWGLFCLRGKFRVEDPAQVKDLRLSLHYVGGVRVYVNGQELCRAHLPALSPANGPDGPIDFDTPAAVYPAEAYAQSTRKLDEKALADLMKTRTRVLVSMNKDASVSIPANMLKKGINLVAVEVHAAALGEQMLKQNATDDLNWSHAGVLAARLSAAGGVMPNVGPSDGIELWTSQPLETDLAWHYALPADRIRPIRIVGARNGSFSGKVVLSSASAIKNLKASISDLLGPDGKGRIPATSVKVRWAERATPQVSSGLHWSEPYRVTFERLLSDFPAEIPAVSLTAGQWKGKAAVVPVWVTVQVPAGGLPGEYKGTLTVEAQGAAVTKFAVPLELKVDGWKIPEPREFGIHHNLYQSPDSVARYYKVPLWSEKHWELLEKSLEALAQVGNKLCVIPLVVNSPAMDNAESMVRWVKQGGDTYTYDFTVLDKYLDLYAAKCGKPGILQISAWENSSVGRLSKEGQAPAPLGVTVFDPATGKTETLKQPPYGTPENEAFWRPVFTELRKRLEKRGWFDVAAELNANYCLDALPENVTVFKHLWPDGKWMSATHSCPSRFGGKAKEDAMPVPYVEWVWGSGHLYDPDYGDRSKTPFYPREWKRGNDRILLANARYGCEIVHAMRDASPLVTYRMVSEAALQGGLRGIGRVGGDFWPLPTALAGKFQAIGGDYGGCSWNCNVMSMTSPGPDGAIFNTRLESFREGVQVAEAILFVQRALESGKLGAGLAGRATALLDERARYYLRAYFHFGGTLNNGPAFVCTNWQERDNRLFELAAEIGN